MRWRASGSRGRRPYRRRIAGVSSFGASGTNAHVIVEQAPEPAAPAPPRPAEILTLSAKTADGLRALARRWSDDLAANPGRPLVDVAFTAAAGRAHFAHRLAAVVRSQEEAARALSSFAAGEPDESARATDVSATLRPRVAFLYHRTRRAVSRDGPRAVRGAAGVPYRVRSLCVADRSRDGPRAHRESCSIPARRRPSWTRPA